MKDYPWDAYAIIVAPPVDEPELENIEWKDIQLHEAIRTVMEDVPSKYLADTAIYYDSGSLKGSEIEAAYRTPDFPNDRKL